MAHYHSTISICTDCLVLLANGDEPQEPCDCGTHRSHEDEMTLGAMDCELCLDAEQTNGPCEEWFSWHPCDACNCSLGGMRSHATVWWNGDAN